MRLSESQINICTNMVVIHCPLVICETMHHLLSNLGWYESQRSCDKLNALWHFRSLITFLSQLPLHFYSSAPLLHELVKGSLPIDLLWWIEAVPTSQPNNPNQLHNLILGVTRQLCQPWWVTRQTLLGLMGDKTSSGKRLVVCQVSHWCCCMSVQRVFQYNRSAIFWYVLSLPKWPPACQWLTRSATITNLAVQKPKVQPMNDRP